jgi:protein-S-isoprenylcysteine O-methyltransferase Ste14
VPPVELLPPSHTLVTQGIYSHIRHPRYLQVVLFEERELRHRFGEEYERYCQHVPRFLPRISRRRAPSP